MRLDMCRFCQLQLWLSYFEAYTLGSDKWIATFRACCMYQILDRHADIMRAYLEIWILRFSTYHSRLTCDKPHDDKEIQSSTQNQLFCATFNYNYTSATLTMIFWNFRFGSFFGIVRLERTLANFRSVSFAWKLSPGIFRFETFVWDLSLWNFRLGSFVW